jgi:RNA polymerase-binding protein DksA
MIQELAKEKIRQRLNAELARLQGHDQGSMPARAQSGQVNVNKDDRAHNYAARERRLALQDMDAQKVEQIQQALERLANGAYGVCISCGEAIPQGRLEIIPYAAHCVVCQEGQA